MDTERLTLEELNDNATEFVFRLLNTASWIKNIGDRNIQSLNDAKSYVQRIRNNSGIRYWVIYTKEKRLPIGILSLIKRDYLEHIDIGFALLPEEEKKGYAYEATRKLVQHIKATGACQKILGITLKDNAPSIRLLEKIGLHLEGERIIEEKNHLIYSLSLR